jgi:DNA-binding MarR family transcriptional regulator
VVTKHQLLEQLAEVGDASAHEVAATLGVPYAAAVMALLRLGRQGLASREFDPRRGTYSYWLTDHGRARLAFFEEEQPAEPRWRAQTAPLGRSSAVQGGVPMKRRKFHSGTYHCPACFIEFDVVAEESLKCDQCGGPLAKGPLDDIWDDEDEEDEADDE